MPRIEATSLCSSLVFALCCFRCSPIVSGGGTIGTGIFTVLYTRTPIGSPNPYRKRVTVPCRCGAAAGRTCGKAPRCMVNYQTRISGPFLDRIDLQIDIPGVTAADLSLPASIEGTAEAAARVFQARSTQADRYKGDAMPVATNAVVSGAVLDRVASPDQAGRDLLAKAADAMRLSARAYHRTLKVARTIADLDGTDAIRRIHIAEALAYRRTEPSQDMDAMPRLMSRAF
jgi:predicted ATPase with chaperone activity